MPECYIRGSTIKYLRIPDEVIDMVKEDAMMKAKGRADPKGRGGGRGRGGPGRGRLTQHLVMQTLKSMLSRAFADFKKTGGSHNILPILPHILGQGLSRQNN